jgi:hypothetical protein
LDGDDACAKADERRVLLDIPHADADLTNRPKQLMIGDKNYFGAQFEAALPEANIELLRPARQGEPDRPCSRSCKPLRQTIWHNNHIGACGWSAQVRRRAGRAPACPNDNAPPVPEDGGD